MLKSIVKLLPLLVLLFVLGNSVLAQRSKSVLLPATEAKSLTNQCSRQSPSDFSGTWTPSDAQIKQMESKFADLRKLKGDNQNIKIENPEMFYMQYVGINIKEIRFVYINAFTSDELPKWWKEKAMIVCDGGQDFWGVLYNVATRKFSDLSANGVA